MTRRGVVLLPRACFIMFCTSLFFLLLMAVSVTFGIRSWPASSPILFATCSGMIIGGQIGTRVTPGKPPRRIVSKVPDLFP